MKRKLLALTLGFTLFLTACGQNPNDLNKNEATTKADENQAVLNPEDVFEQYQKHHPNTQVETFQLDRDHDKAIYKIEGYDEENEYELKIDALSGDIIKEEKDDCDDKDNRIISKEDISQIKPLIEKAISEAGDHYIVSEYEVDYDDDILVLEIELEHPDKDSVEIKFDLKTGNILELNR